MMVGGVGSVVVGWLWCVVCCWGVVCLVLIVVLCGGEPTNIAQRFSSFLVSRNLFTCFLEEAKRLGVLRQVIWLN